MDLLVITAYHRMSVFMAEVARPTLVFRGLLGQAEPILITGGRAAADDIRHYVR